MIYLSGRVKSSGSIHELRFFLPFLADTAWRVIVSTTFKFFEFILTKSKSLAIVFTDVYKSSAGYVAYMA